jgi:hypothetical protein
MLGLAISKFLDHTEPPERCINSEPLQNSRYEGYSEGRLD